MNQTLDLTDALEQIKAGAKIDGKDGVLTPLIKQLIYFLNILWNTENSLEYFVFQI